MPCNTRRSPWQPGRRGLRKRMNDESSRIARKLTAAEAALRIVAAPERGLISAGAYYTGKAGMRAYGVRLIIGRAVSALSLGMCDIRNLREIALAARARFPRKQCVRFWLSLGIEALPCSQAGAGRERDSIARCSPHNRSRVMAEHDFRYNLLNPRTPSTNAARSPRGATRSPAPAARSRPTTCCWSASRAARP